MSDPGPRKKLNQNWRWRLFVIVLLAGVTTTLLDTKVFKDDPSGAPAAPSSPPDPYRGEQLIFTSEGNVRIRPEAAGNSPAPCYTLTRDLTITPVDKVDRQDENSPWYALDLNDAAIPAELRRACSGQATNSRVWMCAVNVRGP